jgi:hypothetical protein
VHGLWPVEELAELAGGPTECGEVARVGCLNHKSQCLFAWNFSVTRSAALTEAERRKRTNMTLSLR